MRLAGKRIVVTGASSGIGRAIAVACAREGATLVLSYRDSAAATQALVDEIQQAGGRAFAHAAQVGDPAAVAALVAQADILLGGIDAWCNVAGADILTGPGAHDPDLQKLARLIDTDLRGTMLCAWAAAPALRRSRGCLLNTSWDLALCGMGGRNPEMFAAVKAGVTGFTRALARSLAPEVRVNEVAPGWIETTFAQHEMGAAYRAGIEAATPLARLGQAREVAAAAVFLLSDEASFISGQTLKVNGGLSS
ncbi:MAG: SDR family oxidoreductase [Gammaproteobacteria bacterium]|nr:SDR family oxidoreductase [Gammaproteobacteria bacterium]